MGASPNLLRKQRTKNRLLAEDVGDDRVQRRRALVVDLPIAVDQGNDDRQVIAELDERGEQANYVIHDSEHLDQEQVDTAYMLRSLLKRVNKSKGVSKLGTRPFAGCCFTP